MRRLFLGCAAIIAFTGSAHAQDIGKRFLVGTPVSIVNQPIDTSRAMRTTANASRSFNLATGQKSTFNLMNPNNLFRALSFGTWPSATPTTPILPQSQNIFQPNRPNAPSVTAPVRKNTN